jgi:hypothetical protein
MADDEFCRAALTILWKSRDIVVEPKPDFNTITDPCLVDHIELQKFSSEISDS